MHRLALQIQFVSSERSAAAFDLFPPSGLDYVESWIRRYDGDSQFILIELNDSTREAEFRQLCIEFTGVLRVQDIAEDECRRRCRAGAGDDA